MKTISIIVALLCLISSISFAQSNKKASNNLLSYTKYYQAENKNITSNPVKAKDTLEIIIRDSNKITFISDSLDIFSSINIDSVFHATRLYLGGSFLNKENSQMIKSFTLDSIANQKPKKKLFQPYAIIADVNVTGGIIRNAFAPGLSFMLGLNFSKESEKVCFLSADMYYFFSKNESNNYSTSINTFVNAGLKVNNAGIGLGWGKGNQFEGSAFKLFTFYSFNNMPVTISPELYIVDGFKKAFPGFTVRLRLY